VVARGGESASCDGMQTKVPRRQGAGFDVALDRWSAASTRLALSDAARTAGALLLAAELDDVTRERLMGTEANSVAPRRCDLIDALQDDLPEVDAAAALIELEERGVATPLRGHAGPWKAAELELDLRVRSYCCRAQSQRSEPAFGPHPSERVERVLTDAAERCRLAPGRQLVILRGRAGSGRDLALHRLLAVLGVPMLRRGPHDLRQSNDALEPELSGAAAVWDPRRTDPSPEDYEIARRFLARSQTVSIVLLDRHQDAPDVDGRVQLPLDLDPRDAAERRQGWEAALSRPHSAMEIVREAALALGHRSRAGAGLAHRVALMIADRTARDTADMIAAAEHALASLVRPSTTRGILVEHPEIPLERIVAPADTVEALRQLVLLSRLSAVVDAPGRVGVKALFSGPSGTGKTMAARSIATALRLPLYRVDLASVVSKWVGETEKNLREALTAAESAGAVLLFDEGDALFGKRGEVTRGADRYANMEVSYLLQAVEAYDGIAIVTTNVRRNVDAAFERRFDACIEFQPPAAPERAIIWRQELGEAGRALGDALTTDIARRADLHGGSIAAAARIARVLATHGGRVAVSEQDLREAVRIELVKSGSSVQAARWSKAER
jgi:hypothetical protein